MRKQTQLEPKIDRVLLSRAEVQANYDRISGWYDILEGMWETKARKSGLQQFGARAGERHLEVGIGTGHSAVTLANSVTGSGHIYGLDLSPRMIRKSKTRLSQNTLSVRTSLTRGDAIQLPFKDESFDGIFMSFVLELFDTPEIPRVLAECYRVLYPQKGRICVVSLTKTGKSTWVRQLYEWGHRNFPKLLDCRPIFVQGALEHAGFRIIERSRISIFGLPVEIILAKPKNYQRHQKEMA
jgi:demethylmenaquinone methyltransferase/2-methoxy-6-polyprenyl-1,4-benzoquinol methylase